MLGKASSGSFAFAVAILGSQLQLAQVAYVTLFIPDNVPALDKHLL